MYFFNKHHGDPLQVRRDHLSEIVPNDYCERLSVEIEKLSILKRFWFHFIIFKQNFKDLQFFEIEILKRKNLMNVFGYLG